MLRQFHEVGEAFSYLESFTNLERTPVTSIRSYRLDRMRALLELFGNPERSVQCIHIAGTKGKGSTGIYVASILAESGYETGFYASPHVSSYTERISRAGEPFTDELYLDMINLVAARLPSLDTGALPARSTPTTFELLTLVGFLVFREAGCQWAVVETGIGGRLDATNVITPEASIITPVEREHTELLGTTLSRIASEKAGIIKPGVPVFSGYQHPAVRAVFEQAASERNSSLRFLSDLLQSVDIDLRPRGSRVRYLWRDGRREVFELSMPGEVQAENAALALLAARSLFDGRTGSRPALDGQAVIRGLRRARLPGRMEIIEVAVASLRAREEVVANGLVQVVLDAAHTPMSVSRLLASFRRIYPGEAILIFGSVVGKDPRGMAEVLARSFRHVFVSTPGSFKKSDPAEVHRLFAARNSRAKLVPSPDEALAAAIQKATPRRLPILVTGSFYMVAEIRALLTERR